MGKSLEWRLWGPDGLQRWVDDPARSVKWYVSDTWAEKPGKIGAKLFIDDWALLVKFGFRTIEAARAWADRQEVPSSCEHRWRHTWFLRPSLLKKPLREWAFPALRECTTCGRRERRHAENGHKGRWKLTLPSAQEAELPR